MKAFLQKHKVCLLFSMFVFCFFAIITYRTPLAGDDWGYAINGMKGNPFVTAIEFYFSWSGRYFSELWGFIVAPNKWLWNLLNPLLFTVIYLCIQILVNKDDKVLVALGSLFLVLYASDYLRMETYTWIMGTTYVVPLAFSLVYFCLIQPVVFYDLKWSKKRMISCIVLNFYIGLCMENIAAVMILANIIVCLYQFFNKKNWKPFAFVGIISLVSFVIMRMSPGSAYRLSENTEWISMSLFEQIGCNISYFLRYTFYDNKYLIILLNGLMCLTALLKFNQHKILTGTTLGLSGLTIVMLLSKRVYQSLPLSIFEFLSAYESNPLCQGFNVLIWIFYIVLLFVFIFTFMDKKNKILGIFFLLLAGASNLVMFVSPIFGSRSSLYFYYFASILVMIVLDQFKFTKAPLLVIMILLAGLSFVRGRTILYKYQMVADVQKDRMEKIQYYLDHPEDKDVWLPRMPIFTIHSADIEEWDTYHMDVFKEYYGLSSECTLHFYVEE